MITAIDRLVDYALSRQLIEACERRYRTNLLYGAFCVDGGVPQIGDTQTDSLQSLLDFLCDEAVRIGRIADTSGSRDRFDSLLMGLVMESPAVIIKRFAMLYKQLPQDATDWFYQVSRDSNYIRSERVAKDVRWDAQTEYGRLELSINLSKPEKDPRDIAAAGKATSVSYPACALCADNEGYAGSVTQQARQNLRIIPLSIHGEEWGMQYSPYVYYDEHCIVLNMEHKPMRIDAAIFDKLLDFIDQFPHYFIGSNADLPIVGGSILSHEHFQGGRHVLPMANAAMETPVVFDKHKNITAGIVKWPMSVLRLQGKDRKELATLAAEVLAAWREYSDESAFIFSQTDGEDHNTITPIARMRGDLYELDLVLRNNITTPQHPLGVFHPHAHLHHIKRENIGLIEVQGLAVLPSRLCKEIEMLSNVYREGGDFSSLPETAPHAEWMADVLMRRQDLTVNNFDQIIKEEIAVVFSQVLEDAGVFKRNEAGKNAFLRFLSTVGAYC